MVPLRAHTRIRRRLLLLLLASTEMPAAKAAHPSRISTHGQATANLATAAAGIRHARVTALRPFLVAINCATRGLAP